MNLFGITFLPRSGPLISSLVLIAASRYPGKLAFSFLLSFVIRVEPWTTVFALWKSRKRLYRLALALSRRFINVNHHPAANLFLALNISPNFHIMNGAGVPNPTPTDATKLFPHTQSKALYKYGAKAESRDPQTPQHGPYRNTNLPKTAHMRPQYMSEGTGKR